MGQTAGESGPRMPPQSGATPRQSRFRAGGLSPGRPALESFLVYF